jgi:curved DNA-binding protein CbpA
MTDCFAALAEPRRPWSDPETLKEKFHQLSAQVHPDRVHSATEGDRQAADSRAAELNAAFQTLREPKSRLQHLLWLERGAKPGDLKTIPEDVVQLFASVGRVLAQTNQLLTERGRAHSPLVKAQLLQAALPHLEAIARLQSAVQTQRTTLMAELTALDQSWDMRMTKPAERASALAEVERLYHLFGFIDRWSGQLQERLVQLTLP